MKRNKKAAEPLREQRLYLIIIYLQNYLSFPDTGLYLLPLNYLA